MRPINLLPPEIGEKRARRRRRVLVIFVAAAYVALLGVGVLFWNARVGAARDDLDTQLALNQTLEREVIALTETAQVQTTFEAKAALVRDALATDINWGVLLNDLGRLLPPRLWVETFSGTVAPGITPGVVGQVAFSGVGFDFPDVSAWLRSLDSEQFAGITGTWVNTITESAIGGSDVVTFTSTAVLTDLATSDRVNTMIPEVP